MAHRIAADALRANASALLRAAGSAAAEAQQVAEHLVLANLSGHDSHGVGMLPRYVDAVLEGGLKPNQSAQVLLDTGALLRVDGQRGYGQVIGAQAMELAMARARQHGSCILSVANAHHLARIGHYAEMAVAQGLVSIHFVNVLSRPIVAPFGGGDGRFGTNPCCIGIPMAGREPFVLDFATSRVAQGKMRVAHNEGRRVEPGLLIDERGQPTTDPGVVVVPQPGGGLGALLPFGEHKGYGLALACELLGGALAGGGTWHRAPDAARAVINGMFAIVIDPERLGTREAFEREARAFADWLRESPAVDDDGVQLPGEPERRARAERSAHGIVIDDGTWAEIVQSGAKVGMPAAAFA
ncbi:MAG: malate/lactate/ureidoglycolate dehydrogenase [Burkholderiaceae bacterium]